MQIKKIIRKTTIQKKTTIIILYKYLQIIIYVYIYDIFSSPDLIYMIQILTPDISK